jgi:hypothetical protein
MDQFVSVEKQTVTIDVCVLVVVAGIGERG